MTLPKFPKKKLRQILGHPLDLLNGTVFTRVDIDLLYTHISGIGMQVTGTCIFKFFSAPKLDYI